MIRLIVAALLLLGSAIAAAACPAPADNAPRLRFVGTDLARPHYTDVIAGGRLDLAACPGIAGVGRVTGEPDFAVEVRGAAPGGVEFRTAGECDTVLLVTGDGRSWHFDDDGAGEGDARLRLPGAPDGRYHVWIGTYGAGSCRARLIVAAVE
jgi:hypothetical protein